MLPDLERLIQLQRLETIIADAKAAITLHPQRLAVLDERLNEAKQAVESVKEELKKNHDRRRELEKDVALYQGRLTKFKDQLSAVKTNREYQAMQHEIATAQSDLGSVEEKVLEQMLADDDLNAAAKKAEAALAAQSKEIEAEKKAHSQELTATEAVAEEVDRGACGAGEGSRAAPHGLVRTGGESPQRRRDLQCDTRRPLFCLPRPPAAVGLPASPPQRLDRAV